MEQDPTRGITKDHKALFELLFLTREWLNKHAYLPMDAKVALGWVYGIIERASDERFNAILATIQETQQTLTHRVAALEEVIERLGSPPPA
jgi:hypothetical protein